jgi:hypothetical protein
MSSNKLWTPREIETALWLDASDANTIKLDGTNKVEMWYDKSGNNRNASETVTYRPLHTTIGTRKAASFNGEQYIGGPFNISLVAESVFVVFRYNSTSKSFARVFTQSDGSNDYQTSNKYIPVVRHDLNNAYGSENASAWASVDVPIDSFVQFSSINSGTKITNQLNGGLQASTNYTWNKTFTRYRLGGALTSTPTTDGLAGEICEIIILNYEADLETKIKIEGYLAHKWGLESNLPVDHTYKSSPPKLHLANGLISYYQFGNDTEDNHHNKYDAVSYGTTFSIGKKKQSLEFNGVNSELILPLDFWKSINYWINENNVWNYYTISDQKRYINAIEYKPWALSFDGVNDYVEIPSSFSKDTDKLSVSFWVYGGESLPKMNSVVDGSASGIRVFNIHFPWSDGVVYWDAGTDGVTYDRIQKAAYVNEYKGIWSHWVFTKNATSGDMKIYRNNSLWHSEGGKNRLLPICTSVRLGTSTLTGDRWWDGKLKDFRIYHDELKVSEINILFNGGKLNKESLWYLMNEGSGLTIYDLVNANNGTINGATWTPLTLDHPILDNPTKYLASTPGNKWALKFDGVDDYADLGNGLNSIFNGGGSIAVEAWVKANTLSTSDYQGIITENYIPSSSNVVITLVYDGVSQNWKFGFYNGSWHVVRGGIPVEGEWIYLAGTYDGTILKLFVNGNEVNSFLDSAGLPAGDESWSLGKRHDNWQLPTNFWNGYIKEVRIWNIARTQQQIQENMYKTLKGDEDGLVLYNKFDEKSGTILTDHTSNNNNGSINGATWTPLEYHTVVGRKSELIFDGVDDYVVADDIRSLRITSDLTIEFFLQTTTTLESGLVTKYDSAMLKRGYNVSINHPTSGVGFIHVAISSTNEVFTGRETRTSIMVNDGLLHHISVVFVAGVSLQIFVDGIDRTQVVSGTVPLTIATNDKKLSIGSIFSNSVLPTYRILNGKISEVRIWNLAITQQQIQENMCKTLKGDEVGLVAYYPMNEGSGLVVYDHSSNHNHGTINGATWQNEFYDGKIDELSLYDKSLQSYEILDLYNDGDGFFYDEIVPYSKRKKIIIDHTKIDQDLLHFPLPIVLGTSTGIDNQDTSDIFYIIGGNYKKLAIYSGTTQLYVEVEQWDHVNKKGLLWVSHENWIISSTEPTEVWIYFDELAEDNNDYVGLPGNRTEVWNENLSARYSLAQDPSGGAGSIIDSTSNTNHGTPQGSMVSGDLIEGQIGASLEFNGISQYVDIGNIISENNELSYSFWIKGNNVFKSEWQGLVSSTLWEQGCFHNPLSNTGNGTIEIVFHDGGVNRAFLYSPILSNDVWYFVNITANSGVIKLFIDGELVDSSNTLTTTYKALSHVIAWEDLNRYFEGCIDEVRIMNIDYSNFIKTDYQAQTDNLLSFEATENIEVEHSQVTLIDPTLIGTSCIFNMLVTNLVVVNKVDVSIQYKILDDDVWTILPYAEITVEGVFSHEIEVEYDTWYEYKVNYKYTYEDVEHSLYTNTVQFLSDTDPTSLTKTVEHIEVVLSSETTVTVPLTKLQTISNCVPFVTLTTDQDLWYRTFADIYFQNNNINGTPEIVVSRGHSTGTVTYSIFIVEFNPQTVKVQQGEFNISTVTTQSITLPEQVIKNRAAVLGYWKTTDSSQLLNRHFVRSSIESDTQIRFYRNNTTGNCTGHWYVFESLQNDFKVTHMQFSSSGGNNYNIPEPVDLLNSFILTSYAHDGSSSYYSYRMSTLLFNRGSILGISIFNSGYISYHHAQIVTFTDDKVHVLFQGYCHGNQSGASGFTYDTLYDADYPLTCNLQNSMVNSYQVYGLAMHNDRYNNRHSFARLKFLDKHRIHIATTGGSDLRYCLQVISWDGKSLRNTPRQDYSNSIVQSIEKYNFEYSHNYSFTTSVIPTIKILDLNKNQDVNNCVPFATYSFNTVGSTSSAEYSRNSFAILKSERCFYVILPSSTQAVTTKAQVDIVEFNPSRFKIQCKEIILNGTTVTVNIDPVISLNRVFCKFYVSISTANLSRQRFSLEWISTSQLRFMVFTATTVFISAYIIESLNDDFHVGHRSFGSITGTAASAHGSNSYDNGFELVSYNYDYDHATSYVSASTLYKFNSCPVSDLYRSHSYNTVSSIFSEHIKFLTSQIKVVAELYVQLNAGTSELNIALPFEVDRLNTIIVCGFQQNLGGVDSGTNSYGQDCGFILLTFKDNKTVTASRTHTQFRVRTYACVIEFPPPNKYYVSGTVREEGVGYIERKVSLYSTETGKLVDTTTSASGIFYLESPYGHAHHVVCNDDTAPKDYNDLIYGKVFPGEIIPVNYSTIYSYVTGNGLGAVSHEGNVAVEMGHDAEFIFEPAAGSALDYIEVNGSKSTSQLDSPIIDYTFYNVKKNQSITTCFGNIYTIETTISGTGSGSVSPNGIVEVIEGRDKTFSFTPNIDSHLNRIIIDNDTTLSGIDTYTFYSVSSDHTLKIIYNIT